MQLCRPLANLQAHAAAHEIRMRAALSQVEDLLELNIETKTSSHQARGPSSSPINSPEKRMTLAEASLGQSAGASTVQTTTASKPDGASS